MNKLFTRVGSVAGIVCTVLSCSYTASALTVQDPDNETAVISVYTDVYVAPTNDASYSDTTNYSIVRDDRNGNKTGLTYVKDFASTNGETHVVSTFYAYGVATTTQPNIKTSNKITFNTLYKGLAGGAFTGLEKIGYQRCQPAQDINYSTFCGPSSVSLPKAQGDVAMGSSFNVKYANITTMADATAIGDSTALAPSVHYSINARGLGLTGQNDNALGSVAAGMKANVIEYNGNNATSTVNFEQHTKASGYVKFSKSMNYNSVIPKVATVHSNIDKVP